MENPGGYDPLADGLKGRSLSIRVERSGSTGAPFGRAHRDLRCLVQAGGVEPPATRLSAEALAVRTGLRDGEVVPLQGFEPRISVCRTDALGR